MSISDRHRENMPGGVKKVDIDKFQTSNTFVYGLNIRLLKDSSMILTLAFALQLQCGLQMNGDNALKYGSLIYSLPGSAVPHFAYFEELGFDDTQHPFCRIIQEKMNSTQPLEITLDSSGKKILFLR